MIKFKSALHAHTDDGFVIMEDEKHGYIIRIYQETFSGYDEAYLSKEDIEQIIQSLEGEKK